MRRIIIILTLAVLAITQNAYSQNQVVYVNAPTVNLRSGPGEHYSVIQVVRKGSPLEVINIQDIWYQVKSSGGVVGWLARSVVTTEKPQGVLVEELKAQLSAKDTEFSKIKSQLDSQIKINAQLRKQVDDNRRVMDSLHIQLRQAEKGNSVKLAIMGTIILLLGSLFGFFIGYFRRQAEDKRFIKMMVETELGRKGRGGM